MMIFSKVIIQQVGYKIYSLYAYVKHIDPAKKWIKDIKDMEI
jgi:hypothetical protein